MEGIYVRRHANAKLGRVEGELRVGSHAIIEASEGQGLVLVTGDAEFEGRAEIGCDFECDSLRLEHGGKLEIRGNLTVRKKLDVAHSVEASGEIRAQEIDVGGKISARSIECTTLRCGGMVEVDDALSAQSVDVGGKVTAGGKVKIVDLTVGGIAEIGGGTISGNTRIGGKLEARSRLDFGSVQAYGRIDLSQNSKGREITVYGRLYATGNLECEKILVEGAAEISGECKSNQVIVDGKLEVRRNFQVSEELKVFGTCEVAGEFLGSGNLKVAGKFSSASRAVLGKDADLAGRLETRYGLKASAIFVRSGSRCDGPIVGERVFVGSSKMVVANWGKRWAGQEAVLRLIGKMTRVEDVYAKEAYLGRYSRCERVFAERVELEEGAIAEEIIYTHELIGPVEKCYINSPPRRVSNLPESPVA